METLENQANSVQTPKRKNVLKGLTLYELKNYFKSINEPRFRGEQIFNWMYNHLVSDFMDMANIPKVLRIKLAEENEIVTLDYVDSKVSPLTGTKKYIFKTKDDYLIESVIIPDEDRTTLCISTQVGCPLDCKFCATGLMGYKKNLSTGEIFDQYRLAANDYGKDKITNIVFMGMGEPLLNFNATLNALRIFGDDLTKGISLKKITVSTVGIAPKIRELADSGIRVKLAFSLHSCFEDIRSKIIPINEKYSLKENIESLRYYIRNTGLRITFEYIMLDGINDREEDLVELTKLCSSMPCKVNVIPFNSLSHMNPTGLSAELKSTPLYRMDEFVQRLRDKNITVTVRYTQGEDIAAACGQLAANTESKIPD